MMEFFARLPRGDPHYAQLVTSTFLVAIYFPGNRIRMKQFSPKKEVKSGLGTGQGRKFSPSTFSRLCPRCKTSFGRDDCGFLTAN